MSILEKYPELPYRFLCAVVAVVGKEKMDQILEFYEHTNGNTSDTAMHLMWAIYDEEHLERKIKEWEKEHGHP